MNPVERRVRAHIINALVEAASAPSVAEISDSLELSRVDVACVDREVLRGALDMGFADYEDAVLHEAARAAGAAAIVTRNGKHFTRATLPVFSPVELLAALQVDGA